MIGRTLAQIAILFWLAACTFPAPGVIQPAATTGAAPPALGDPTAPAASPESASSTPEMTAQPLPIRATELELSPTTTFIVTPAAIPTAVITLSADQPQESAMPDQSTQTFYRYLLQPGTPVYLPNFVRIEAGCSFTGVAGQVFDAEGEPILGLLVGAQGVLDGQSINGLDMTGLSPSAGPGGYVISLANRAIESRASITVQILDFQANLLSAPVVIDTYADCERNLALVNFVLAPGPVYLPLLLKP